MSVSLSNKQKNRSQLERLLKMSMENKKRLSKMKRWRRSKIAMPGMKPRIRVIGKMKRRRRSLKR